MAVDYMQAVDRSWPVLRRLMRGHAMLYRASGGRIGHRLPGLPQMLLLDHVGAKSGTPRTTPLLYASDGENLLIVASKGGHPKNPAWYHNLLAHPDTTVQVGGEHRDVHARVARDPERGQLWPLVVLVYPTYDSYQRRTDRQIPLVVLEPR
jgi:deazaflavin-dependent oxidoreductase (nitroreductase family)